MSTLKCPNCKAELPSSSTICEWCSFVLNRSGEDSVEQVTSSIIEYIKAAKQLPEHDLFSALRKNAKISMPLFAVTSFVLAYKLSWMFALLGLLFLVFALLSLFRKSDNSDSEMQRLNAAFETETMKLYKLYGANNAISQQINQFKVDWSNIMRSRSRSKKVERISYLIIILFFSIALIAPQSKTDVELRKEQAAGEMELVQQAEMALQSNNLAKLDSILLQIKAPEHVIKIKSMRALKEIEFKLLEAETLIKSSNFEEAQRKLKQLKWIKIATDYDMELIEEPFFKQFVSLKNGVNDLLPDNYKIEPEDELSF